MPHAALPSAAALSTSALETVGTDTIEQLHWVMSGSGVFCSLRRILRWKTVDQRGPRHYPSFNSSKVFKVHTQANNTLKPRPYNDDESPTAIRRFQISGDWELQSRYQIEILLYFLALWSLFERYTRNGTSRHHVGDKRSEKSYDSVFRWVKRNFGDYGKISSDKKVKCSVKWCFVNIGRIQENFARRKIISERKHA